MSLLLREGIFVRSGWLYVANGVIGSPGAWGGDWASYTGDATSAYRLYFNETTVWLLLNNYYRRFIGFPLRCLSTVLGM